MAIENVKKTEYMQQKSSSGTSKIRTKVQGESFQMVLIEEESRNDI